MTAGKYPTYNDPTIQYLTQVLAFVREGSLRVPRFQRPFIWLEDRQIELLRSIKDGIPIGAIMVWKTTDAPVEYYRMLGRFPVAIKEGARPQQYLLDGVQRITTLYAALTPPEQQVLADADELDDPSRVVGKVAYYSFAEDDFVFAEPGSVAEELMPLSVVVDTLSLLKYQRLLAEKRKDDWLEKSDAIASAFREYKIPLIPIVTDDLSIATLTFQRINQQGARMSDLHMIHALTWSDSFDLQDRLSVLKEDILGPYWWGGLDDEVILKVCKGLRGLNLYKTEPKELSKILKSAPTLLKDAVESIAWAAGVIKEELNIVKPELVPYSFQIVFLALVRDSFQATESHRELLRRWFWFTTYTEAFSGMSDDRVKRALDDLRATFLFGRPVWSNTKKSYSSFASRERFDFRSVRSKASAYALASNIKEHLNIDAFGCVAEYGVDAIHSLVLKPLKNLKVGVVGNKYILSPHEVKAFRSNMFNENLTDFELAAHFLTKEDVYNLRNEGFFDVEARGERIADYEKRFCEATAGEFSRALTVDLFGFE